MKKVISHTIIKQERKLTKCLYCHLFYYHDESSAHIHTRNKFCSSDCENNYDKATTDKPINYE